MAVRRDDEAGREFEPDHEWPLLRRAAQQCGGLRPRRQRGRRRAPFHGIGLDDRVMRLVGLELRDRGDHGAGGKCRNR
jgi:hypothetical protein